MWKLDTWWKKTVLVIPIPICLFIVLEEGTQTSKFWYFVFCSLFIWILASSYKKSDSWDLEDWWQKVIYCFAVAISACFLLGAWAGITAAIIKMAS